MNTALTTAQIGAAGQAWAMQSFAAAGIVTAVPVVDHQGVDLVACHVGGDGFQAAALQLKTTTDGQISLFRDRYPPWMGMLYVLFDGPDLATPPQAYLLPQEWARQIGERHFGDKTDWNSKQHYYRCSFKRVRDDFAEFSFDVGSAEDRLQDIIHRPTCFGSARR